jgi:hypothetical protein
MKAKLTEKKQLFYIILAIAFIACSIGFFYNAAFFNDKGRVIYPRYLPENKWLGNDFFIDYSFSSRYFVEHKSAYISDDLNEWYAGNPYPPIFTFTMGPLFWLNISKETGYNILVWIIFGAFLFMTMVLPIFYTRKISISGGQLFVIATGIASYGMQFALERGQLDIIAMFFGLTAVYIFWFFPKYRLLAYFFLFMGFQYKIYPIYLLPCFIDDLQHPKKSIIRVGGIALACFVSLFVMGTAGFTEFIRSLTSQKVLAYVRDHGIINGTTYMLKVLNLPYEPIKVIVAASAPFLILSILSFVGLVLPTIRKKTKIGFSPALVLWCTIASMILFPSSKDYKLVVMFGAVVLFAIHLERLLENGSIRRMGVLLAGLTLFSLGYCGTVYSYGYRPLILQNSFIFLFLIMVSIPLIEMSITAHEDVVGVGYCAQNEVSKAGN